MAIHHSKVVSTVNRLRIWTGDSFDTAPSYNTSPSFLALRLRGGGAIEGAAAGFPTVGSINLGKALPVVGAALLAGFTITIVEKVPRSGGHAPSSVTAFLGHLGIDKVGSTGLFHLAYFLHCFVVLAVMPQGLKEVVFSPTGTLLLGTIFPLVESIKTAARSDDKSDAVSRTWLMYWVMHGTFSYASQDASRTIARFGPSGGKHWYGECLRIPAFHLRKMQTFPTSKTHTYSHVSHHMDRISILHGSLANPALYGRSRDYLRDDHEALRSPRGRSHCQDGRGMVDDAGAGGNKRESSVVSSIVHCL